MAETEQVDERQLSTTTIPGAVVTDAASGTTYEGEGLVLVNDGVPTQVANPKRAGWRTFVQALVTFLPLANGILLAVQLVLEQPDFAGYVPGWAFAVVNGGILLSAFVAKLVAQVMAAPGVNEWIKAHVPALAAIPLRAVEAPTNLTRPY